MTKAEVGAYYIEADAERTAIALQVVVVLDVEVFVTQRHIADEPVDRGTYRHNREEFERTHVRATPSMSFVPDPKEHRVHP